MRPETVDFHRFISIQSTLLRFISKSLLKLALQAQTYQKPINAA
jgi:hypothetical protein